MNKLKLAAAISAALLMAACGSDDNDSKDPVVDPGTDSSGSSLNLENVQKALKTNADIAYAAYSDSVITAQALKAAIAAFKAEPTQANLDAAKLAWLVAREPYGQTEVYRFRMSPIDSSDYSSEDGPEGDINAWPLGEALIDYVKTNDSDFGTDQIGVTAHQTDVNNGEAIDANVATNSPAENIIGNREIVINADLLANTATAEDEHDVISGYHAIEFLLWGQDLNNDAMPTDGTDRGTAVKTWAAQNLAFGGQRPLTDFTTDANADRRFQFLEVAVDKLIADLQQVRDGWAEGASYRTAFMTVSNTADAKQKLAEIMTGMGTLSEGELGGERMQIAFSANSQEDEHSCFSDNTHRDIWLNAEGVSNSFYGRYAGYDSDLDGVDDVTTNAVDGYGLDDLLNDQGQQALVTTLTASLTKTENAYTAIDTQARAGTPFDVLIQSTDSTSVADTIIALNEQAAVITQIANTLELGTVVVDPEASACDTTNPTQSCDE
ncbi:peptidase, imelysin family protein [Bacterioplanes sanyensis]|uniref:Peptidase, imelysin family protein n=1 Tax=Bacterioplanes sanyensis TaxID=1249553 RepID=A0A222FNS8_9GAMM|nr:imelysin family protein [Bacterioplanes sanyensis]ASP40685.1 peptidase, imelysin family protein [Bacterioplanes sanyensis]